MYHYNSPHPNPKANYNAPNSKTLTLLTVAVSAAGWVNRQTVIVTSADPIEL
jgi:hypothetical protein